MRKVMKRFVLPIAISITSLSGCGRGNATNEAAKLMNAMITQATLGQDNQSTVSAGQLVEVDCGKDAYSITTGQLKGTVDSNTTQSMTLKINMNFNVFLSGTTASNNPTLTCTYHATWGLSSDNTHLVGAGQITTCDDFDCQWDSITFTCDEMKAALLANPCP